MQRVGFVGIRTPAVTQTAEFFRDVLGLPLARNEDHWGIATLPTGPLDMLEIYGPEFCDPRLVPDDASVFVGFIVDDVVEARQEVLRAGVEADDIVWAAEAFDNAEYEGFGWFFFRAPDGRRYIIEQVPQ